MKTQYDESNNVAIRATRAVTDGLKGIVGKFLTDDRQCISGNELTLIL